MRKSSFAQWLTRLWYKDPFLAVWLKPFSMIYHDIVQFRRFLYKHRILKSYALSVPVIVVGNITVGGTGKTPFIIYLAHYLQQAGYKPGIISRGYGGNASSWPQWVDADSSAQTVGDEAILLFKHAACPVAVGPSRRDAGQLLIQRSSCDIILSDDGLQHYRLQRQLEIIIIDGTRRFGNGAFLPGGPLREPISRIREVDLLVCNSGEPEEGEYMMQIEAGDAINLHSGEHKPLHEFVDLKCHALAGIGNPQRFFDTLQQAGINCSTEVFLDHYAFQPQDIENTQADNILMTEKDAVKCLAFASERHWYVPVKAVLQADFEQQLAACLENIKTPA